jgi:flagellar biogenesis protein FliO
MALAFVLGLVLTGAFTVRRVTREVPSAATADEEP